MTSFSRSTFVEDSLRNLDAIDASVSADTPPTSYYISNDTFQQLPIRMSPMPFNCAEELDFGLKFVRLLPSHVLDEWWPDAQQNVADWISEWNEEPWDGSRVSMHSESWLHSASVMCSHLLLAASQPVDWDAVDNDPNYAPPLNPFDLWGSSSIRFPNGAETIWGRDPLKWCVGAIKDTARTGLPHVSCLLAEEMPLDNRVLRSELQCVTTVMKHRMHRHHHWQERQVFPVFVYTFSCHYVRITQAHWDGQYLHLRRTEPFNINTEDRKQFKLLVRWMTGTPTGPTKWAYDEQYFQPQANETPSQISQQRMSIEV